MGGDEQTDPDGDNNPSCLQRVSLCLTTLKDRLARDEEKTDARHGHHLFPNGDCDEDDRKSDDAPELKITIGAKHEVPVDLSDLELEAQLRRIRGDESLENKQP